MKQAFLFGIILSGSYMLNATPESVNCTVFEHKPRHHRDIESAEILCRNVPPNFLIDNFYFIEKPYPQDVIITESIIPTVSNYSSLLNMRYIRKLHMKGLGIKHILPGAFRSMEKLEDLDLGYNLLTELPGGVFSGLINLRRVYLPSNNITVEPQKNVFKDLQNLEYVDFSDNPVQYLNPDNFVKKVFVKAVSSSP